MSVLRPTVRHLAALGAALPILAGMGLIGSVFIEKDNFRTTSADLYRSGQLQAGEWQKSLDGAHYRSVLNLRGAKPYASWYKQEIKFAADHSLEHYDYALSARDAPSIDQMMDIVEVMRRAPKPLLIHCKNGSDRSGLVAALYVLAIEGRPAEEASRQLSLWYGHFPWLGSKTVAMDKALSRFVSTAATHATAASQDADAR